MRPDDPGRYGRVLTEGGYVTRIVEWAGATDAERTVGLCNAGVLCGPAAEMKDWLSSVITSYSIHYTKLYEYG